MDPISAVASIVGLVGAAAKVSEVLFNFIRTVKDAPKLASSVLQEVSDTSACLIQLQNYLLRNEGPEGGSRSHEKLLMIEQIVVVLSNCVLIFSELEKMVDPLQSGPSQPARMAQWMFKERAIKTLFTRLQSSKGSLNLMMTTLTCASMGEAQASVSELAVLVTRVLESNHDISRRMADLEQQTLRRLPSTIPTSAGRDPSLSPSSARTDATGDTESVVTIKGVASSLHSGRNEEPNHSFGFSFDQDLEMSRPYARAMKRHGVWSTASSEIPTMGWSCLSGLSLAEVSHISVINLTVYPQELWNGERYLASQFDQVGFVLSKSQSRSFGSRRGGNLGTIKEDLRVPVAASKLSLLGGSLSGKTTIFNHLQLLYGNSITFDDRSQARSDIVRNLARISLEAFSWCEKALDSDDDDEANYLYELSTVGPNKLTKGDWASDEQVLRYFWNYAEVRDAILDKNFSAFDENVPYHMDHLQELFEPNEALSDATFLRLNRRGLGVYRQPINIDDTQYEVHDPSQRNKWVHCLSDVDVIIYVASLTGYYQASPGRSSDKDIVSDMLNSLEEFAALTKKNFLISTPFIVLLNKFDLLEEKMKVEPICKYFPSYSGSLDPSLACSFFASEFLRLDERPNASLRIYKTSAVDRDSFKATFDNIAQWLSQY